MKESYLHWLWENKVFPSRYFTSYQNEEIEVLDFGTMNVHHQGPDFQHASVRIQDCILHGSIEIHLKSSDWLAHGHTGDVHYENVILHAVWEHDLDGTHPLSNIPTIELSRYAFSKGDEEVIPTAFRLACSNGRNKLIYTWPINYQWKLIRGYFLEKAKVNHWEIRNDRLQVLYEMIGAAFGAKVNQHAFVRLCSESPWLVIHDLPEEQRNVIFLSKSGLLDGNKRSYFQFKGLRPNGHPKQRILQFSKFLSSISIPALANIKPGEARLTMKGLSFLSEDMKDRLFFDAILPFHLLGNQHKYSSLEKQEWMDFFVQKRARTNSFIRSLVQQGIPLNSCWDMYFWKAKYKKDCARLNCLKCPLHQINLEVIT